ncbi:RNA-directed DNA polymerase [Verrucomicrobium sp. BvORR106]|uniref:RNA-directed DNA polymerase n=1 Tax=Verrucomicrobium sp. BvORR106 TaxID=1403819 RepID=UPI002240F83F|nr:RNA-directed DNA polymerase [Verrucomicrobium sp. BvORR106]
MSHPSISWALQHIARYGDTDVFPIAFEYQAFQSIWPTLLDALHKVNIAEHELGAAIRMMVPKHVGGYRSATQTDPVDSLLLLAMVYEMAPQIEGFRIPVDIKISCAYRLEIESNGQFFSKDSGWGDFQEKSKELVDDFLCTHVVCTDVSDFYNQISHHRVQNSLGSAQVAENRSHVLERFLSNLNALHHSRGIPVGPTSSILLAECALADVDNYLMRRQFKHTRYVDDFRIFCDSEEEAVKALHELSDYLFKSHRLSLQPSKTRVLSHDEFKSRELHDPEKMEQDKKTRFISNMIEEWGFGPYGAPQANIDEVEQDAIRESIVELFDELLQLPVLPLGLTRYVLRRAGAIRSRAILQRSLDNVDKLIPALRDLIIYWCKVADKKRPEQIGERLKWIIQDSKFRSLPYVQYWILSAFESNPTLCDSTTAIALAEDSDPQIRDRMAALLARKHGIVDWVRSRKETWLNTSAWGQRAIIWSSSALPKNERMHWLKSIANYPVLSIRSVAKASMAMK